MYIYAYIQVSIYAFCYGPVALNQRQNKLKLNHKLNLLLNLKQKLKGLINLVQKHLLLIFQKFLAGMIVLMKIKRSFKNINHQKPLFFVSLADSSKIHCAWSSNSLYNSIMIFFTLVISTIFKYSYL